mmetsp:Transcript_57747/g.125599  ORF Transcript_57747/g.125599 Transcript_57747/m.125599 type:complete len:87 (+) Transcript_57747:1367-1627(+)
MSKLGEQADLMHYGIDKLYHTSTDSDTPLTQTETKHLRSPSPFPVILCLDSPLRTSDLFKGCWGRKTTVCFSCDYSQGGERTLSRC